MDAFYFITKPRESCERRAFQQSFNTSNATHDMPAEPIRKESVRLEYITSTSTTSDVQAAFTIEFSRTAERKNIYEQESIHGPAVKYVVGLFCYKLILPCLFSDPRRHHAETVSSFSSLRFGKRK